MGSGERVERGGCFLTHLLPFPPVVMEAIERMGGSGDGQAEDSILVHIYWNLLRVEMFE